MGDPGGINQFNSSNSPMLSIALASETWPWQSTKPSGPMTACMFNRLQGWGRPSRTLFPAVKALGQGLAAKIFYLTAKTSGRLVAEKALDDLRQANLYFRSVTLTAKEKICFCPPVNCDPEVCVFARGYFDKVKKALEEIDRHQAFTRPVIEEIARQYEICPFEFSLDLALWVDCIICDYNYAFDPRVYLHRFFDFGTEPYVFLIDEAHNLPDRARSMYSAEVDKRTVLNLQHTLKLHLPKLVKKLSTINKILLEIRKACQAEGRDVLIEYEPPKKLLKAIREFNQKAEDWLALNQPAEFRQELLAFYFLCSNYLRTAEYFDTFYVSYFERQGQADIKAKLFCLDPAPNAGHAAGAQPIGCLFLGDTAAHGLLYKALDRRCGSSQANLPVAFPAGKCLPADPQQDIHQICAKGQFIRCHCLGD